MKNQCAFPQPITPSGYELNENDNGLNKYEYFMGQAITGAATTNAKPEDVAKRAEEIAAAVMKRLYPGWP